jgi:hypothetical protein
VIIFFFFLGAYSYFEFLKNDMAYLFTRYLDSTDFIQEAMHKSFIYLKGYHKNLEKLRQKISILKCRENIQTEGKRN